MFSVLMRKLSLSVMNTLIPIWGIFKL